MTITQLAQKHNLEPESAKAFLRDVLDMQPVVQYSGKLGSFTCYADSPDKFMKNTTDVTPLIARPTDLGE